MKLLGILNAQFTMLQTLEFFLRVIIACICGAVIGLERSRRLKEAGIRTHVIVCATAALLMIVSKYGFADTIMNEIGSRGADNSRIAAQVVSGISFLCAGVIIKERGNIRGLTTAAGLWMTTAIGLTFGSGLYSLGIFVTILMLLFQLILHRVTFGVDSMISDHVVMKVIEPFSLETEMELFLKGVNGTIEGGYVRYGKQCTTYQFTIRTKKTIPTHIWRAFMKTHPAIKSLEHNKVF